jgi:glucose-6-phosphate 1-dehydrogenase
MPLFGKPEPCVLVIFGASGDLTRRKLVPALFEMYRAGHLPAKLAVMGVSRSPMTDDEFRTKMREFPAKDGHFDEEQWKTFAQMLHYHAGDATVLSEFEGIKVRIAELSVDHDTGENVLFYLSVAPNLAEPIIVNIGAAGLVTEGKRWCSLTRTAPPWQRIIIEKPFGHDLTSAQVLNRVLGRVFEEEAIFRIDHYLGKETVQNLMVFRFANVIFEPLWNRNYIDNVQITAAETVGVEGRGGYYEGSGAMRDMIQSHLLQLMATVAMEPPNSFKALDIRTEQRKVLEAVRDIPPDRIDEYAVRGQYGPGTINGKEYPAYRQEKGVATDSNTETYAALRLRIDNFRWQGVPFVLRTGKAMKRKLTQIVVYFKPTPHCMFTETAGEHSPVCDLKPNRLVINVQPDEGISLRFEGKVPGQGLSVKSAVMDFDYLQQFGGRIPEAYGNLLLDAMAGDRSLFKDRHEIEAAWRIVMPVLDHWAANPGVNMHTYDAGSWGPAAAEGLFRTSGHWHNPEGELSRWRKQ